jgi:hypothetical protein
MVQPWLRPRPSRELERAIEHGLIVLADVGLDNKRVAGVGEGPVIAARHAHEGRDVEGLVELVTAGGAGSSCLASGGQPVVLCFPEGVLHFGHDELQMFVGVVAVKERNGIKVVSQVPQVSEQEDLSCWQRQAVLRRLVRQTFAQRFTRVAEVIAIVEADPGYRSHCGADARAREAAGPNAPVVDKIRAFHNHPGFIEAMVDRVRAALGKLPEGSRESPQLIYTAHSIPYAMARSCDYEVQLRETGRLLAEELGRADWQLVCQSRSGPPRQRRPWKASRNAGLSRMVSERALIIFWPMLGSFAQYGIKPQRTNENLRTGCSRSLRMMPTFCVGAML